MLMCLKKEGWSLHRTVRVDRHTSEYQTKPIAKVPTVEPERKKGKWFYKNDLKQFFCSECGFPSLTYDDIYIYSMDLPNFCEDCGADMREDQDESD